MTYICENCGKEFEVDWRKGNHKDYPRFCSRSCANSRKWSNDHNVKLSKKMKGYHFGMAVGGIPLTEEHKNKISNSNKKHEDSYYQGICEWCHKPIDLKNKKNKEGIRHFCNGTCRNLFLNANKEIGYGSHLGYQVSKWELQFRELLDKYHIYYESNKRDLIPSKYEIDIWIPNKKMAIELNGIWHYDPKVYNYNMEKFNKRIQKDKIKEKEVKELGYTFIVFKDNEIENKEKFFEEFIKQNLL